MTYCSDCGANLEGEAPLYEPDYDELGEECEGDRICPHCGGGDIHESNEDYGGVDR